MKRSESRPSVPSHFVAFARRLPPRAPVFVAPHKPDAGLGPGVFGSGHPQGLSLSRRRRSGVPSSWGTPIARLPCSVDAGRTAGTRPLRCRGVAPGMCKAEAPAKGLSALNSTAFGLAAYASPGGLPRPDARLASSRWSGVTGRAFTRRAPTKGFGVLVTSHPPFPSLHGAITSTATTAGLRSRDTCRLHPQGIAI